MDYAIGVEPYNMFFTVGDSLSGFKFYGGPTCCTTIAGNGNITATGSVAAASAQITNNCTVGGTLTVGALTTTGFYACKPYVGFHTINDLVSSSVKPGFVQSGITLSKPAVGTYTFTIPTHPKAAIYMVFVQQQGNVSTGAIANYTVGNISSTSFTVYSKSTANVLTDSNFYVHSVP